MSRTFFGIGGIVVCFAILAGNVSAEPANIFKEVRGKINVTTNSQDKVTTVTIKSSDGEEVHVVLDDVTKDMVKYNGYEVLATETYTNGDYKVSSWLIRNSVYNSFSRPK